MSEILKCILTLFSGCAVFMIGMHLLGEGLEKSAGSGMRRIFSKVDKNPVVNVGVGAVFTAIIQSSGATTVMVVGFVNAGVMSLLQAAYVIMGANIGTTITGVLVSFAAFDVMDYAAILAFIGMLLTFFKSETLKKIGQICAGFGFVFVGLSIMSGSFKEAEDLKLAFASLFESISFPLLLVLIGALVTALMQSSSTMTGILIMLVANGAIPMASALYLVLGSNIGTCLTAFLASAGTSINAKRAAVIHLLFNVIGSMLFLILIMCLEGPVTNLLNSVLPNQPGMQLAWFHVAFNVTTTLVLVFFAKGLTRLAEKIVPDKKKVLVELKPKYIDDRLLSTPPIAVEQVYKEVLHMACLARENVNRAFVDFENWNDDNAEQIANTEVLIDYTNHSVTSYLIKLGSRVSERDERTVGSLFHVVNDVERIGDHAENFAEIVALMRKENIAFSAKAKEELLNMYRKIDQMYELALEIFETKKTDRLEEISQFEEEIDDFKDNLSSAHVERLMAGNCNMELGAHFYTMIAGLERVADHLVNVAYSVVDPTGSQVGV